MPRITQHLWIILLFLLVTFLLPKKIHAEEYYFNDEFNLERPVNTLDSSKWVVYPNNEPFNFTVRESNGVVLFTQKFNTSKFPLAVSKNALPNSNFEAEIKFRYTKVTYWGTGIGLSEKEPKNGEAVNLLLTINVWQDLSVGPNMRIDFNGSSIYTSPTNTNDHILKIERDKQIYRIYLDNILIHTSLPIPEQVQYIWMGNPDYFGPPIPDWTNFIVDYIRVKDIPPQPFLELPWDYQSSGLTFTDAALSINSFFDHEFPLLSSGLNESAESSGSLTNYEGRFKTNLDYSSHDGYDYGRKAKVGLSEPVLAGANGWATFSNSCSACGNAILIDHENGYQTRYYHLLANGLITNNSKVKVSAGQQIGLVGSTGHSTGAHIHFMVVQDKNGDGNFEDNLPDGVTDPFGWQSKELDPWESYLFSYSGKNRIGNKSYYLWKNKIDNLNSELSANGGIFNLGKFNLNFPQGATDESLSIELESSSTKKTNNLISIGTTLLATAKDGLGNIFDQFNTLYTLTVNFNNQDTSNINPSTISLYSSEDGQNWNKEVTNLDLSNKVASAQLNHFSYFALMGERIDTIAPVTTPVLNGLQGQPNWFSSDVEVVLNADDNGGLGVDYIMYKLEGKDWEVYSSPLTFAEEGSHRVEFYSADLDENVEEVKTVEFNIDKTLPAASLDANPKILWPPLGKMVNINIEGTSGDEHLYNTILEIDDEYDELDSNEIVTSNFSKITQLEAKRDGSDMDGREYIIKLVSTDLAGNKKEGISKILVPHNL